MGVQCDAGRAEQLDVLRDRPRAPRSEQTFVAQVQALAPRMHLRLDEQGAAAGLVAADASGNGHDGTYFGPVGLGAADPFAVTQGSAAQWAGRARSAGGEYVQVDDFDYADDPTGTTNANRIDVTAPVDGRWHLYACTVSATRGVGVSIDGFELARQASLGGAAFDPATPVYLLLGSASGVAPGVPLGPGLQLPLNVDGYLVHTARFPNTPPLVGFAGVLDAGGRATAQMTMPGGLAPAGLVLHHASALAEGMPLGFSFQSNAVRLDLIP